MQLTEDERAALDKHRSRRDAYPDHDEPTNRYRLQTDEAVTLADMALRLFPVRTYGDLVIRWDDEITRERLQACGFRSDNGICSMATRSKQVTRYESGIWAVTVFAYGIEEKVYPIPRSMLDVWSLVERCGIEEGGK